MRKLLIVVVVLLLLGAAADFAAARVFEDRVTEALQREYDLGRRPVVQVRDVPFLPRLLTGRFSTTFTEPLPPQPSSATAGCIPPHAQDADQRHRNSELTTTLNSGPFQATGGPACHTSSRSCLPRCF